MNSNDDVIKAINELKKEVKDIKQSQSKQQSVKSSKDEKPLVSDVIKSTVTIGVLGATAAILLKTGNNSVVEIQSAGMQIINLMKNNL